MYVGVSAEEPRVKSGGAVTIREWDSWRGYIVDEDKLVALRDRVGVIRGAQEFGQAGQRPIECGPRRSCAPPPDITEAA